MENPWLDEAHGVVVRGRANISGTFDGRKTSLHSQAVSVLDKQIETSVYAGHTVELHKQLSAHARETLLSSGRAHRREAAHERQISDTNANVVYIHSQIG